MTHQVMATSKTSDDEDECKMAYERFYREAYAQQRLRDQWELEMREDTYG